MRYTIEKDDIAEKLFSIPNFRKDFEKSCNMFMHDRSDFVSVRSEILKVSDEFRCTVNARIPKAIIRDTREFSETEWNEFPTVLPPLDVVLQVEIDNEGAIFRSCGWFTTRGTIYVQGFGEFDKSKGTLRYKVWK